MVTVFDWVYFNVIVHVHLFIHDMHMLIEHSVHGIHEVAHYEMSGGNVANILMTGSAATCVEPEVLSPGVPSGN